LTTWLIEFKILDFFDILYIEKINEWGIWKLLLGNSFWNILEFQGSKCFIVGKLGLMQVRMED
jgi:hypothetical protein